MRNKSFALKLVKNIDSILVIVAYIFILIFGFCLKTNHTSYLGKTIFGAALFSDGHAFIAVVSILLFSINIALSIVQFIIVSPEWKFILRLINFLLLLINFAFLMHFAFTTFYINGVIHE